jgi:hypothetical protein
MSEDLMPFFHMDVRRPNAILFISNLSEYFGSLK